MNKELYISVIFQGIRDAASKNERLVYKAFDWFGSTDFEIVCQKAELNHKSLRKSLLGLLSSDNPKQTAEDMISAIRGTFWQKESKASLVLN
jgi:hypothetical protein